MTLKEVAGVLCIGVAVLSWAADYRLFGLPWHSGALLLGLLGCLLLYRARRARRARGDDSGSMLDDLSELEADID